MYYWETYYGGVWTKHLDKQYSELEAFSLWGCNVLGAPPIPYRRLLDV